MWTSWSSDDENEDVGTWLIYIEINIKRDKYWLGETHIFYGTSESVTEFESGRFVRIARRRVNWANVDKRDHEYNQSDYNETSGPPVSLFL